MRKLITILGIVAALAAAPASAGASIAPTLFHNPTGNVGCGFFPNARMVSCADFSSGRIASLDPVDPAETEVATHLGRDFGLRPGAGSALGYGKTLRFRTLGGSLHCTAIAGTGVKCWSAKSGFGFVVGRGVLQRF
jgi:hypothetical protein